MWATYGFSSSQKLQHDLILLGMVSQLYLFYKKGILNDPLKNEIYALYRSQLCDPALQELFIPLMTYLHHPDDFITAIENKTLQEMGCAALIWQWLETASSSIYHLLHESVDQQEELLFHLLLLMLALSSIRNLPCIEKGFWKWSTPLGKDFITLFPQFLSNFFYWKNTKNNVFDWKNCKNMFQEFLSIVPKTLQEKPFYQPLFEHLQNNLKEMEKSPHHWPQGCSGWPSPMSTATCGGKWISEMVEQWLFYTSLDNGLTATCREANFSSFLYNFTTEICSFFFKPLTIKDIESLIQKLSSLPSSSSSTNEENLSLFTSLLSWKHRFLQANSVSVTFFDPKKNIHFFANIPEPLEFALLHPEQVFVTVFSPPTKKCYSTTFSFLCNKELIFQNLPDPRKELEKPLAKLS